MPNAKKTAIFRHRTMYMCIHYICMYIAVFDSYITSIPLMQKKWEGMRDRQVSLPPLPA